MRFRLPVDPPLLPAGSDAPAGTYVVTRPFGDLTFPQYGPHDGLDIGNKRSGDPIYAIEAGWVIYAGFDASSGGAGIVRIDHGDGWSSGYAHLERIMVNIGQFVLPGEQIGTLGATGWTSGAHLHFGILRNRIAVDPWPLITQAGGEYPMFNSKDVLELDGTQLRVKAAGANFREKQGTSYPVLRFLAPGTELTGTARVVGEPAGGSIEWWGGWAEVDGVIRFGFMHTSTVDVIPEIPDDESFVKGFEEARIKASAAAASIKP